VGNTPEQASYIKTADYAMKSSEQSVDQHKRSQSELHVNLPTSTDQGSSQVAAFSPDRVRGAKPSATEMKNPITNAPLAIDLIQITKLDVSEQNRLAKGKSYRSARRVPDSDSNLGSSHLNHKLRLNTQSTNKIMESQSSQQSQSDK